jgi:CHAT domain-containing protein
MLTTTAFASLKGEPRIGRAEALRRAMAALISNGRSHPATWASFALVGEGGR